MELGRIGIYRCQAQDTGGGVREAAAELDDPPRTRATAAPRPRQWWRQWPVRNAR